MFVKQFGIFLCELFLLPNVGLIEPIYSNVLVGLTKMVFRFRLGRQGCHFANVVMAKTGSILNSDGISRLGLTKINRFFDISKNFP